MNMKSGNTALFTEERIINLINNQSISRISIAPFHTLKGALQQSIETNESSGLAAMHRVGLKVKEKK